MSKRDTIRSDDAQTSSPVPLAVLRVHRASNSPGYLLQPCVPQADQAANLTHTRPVTRATYPDVYLRLGPALRSSRAGVLAGPGLVTHGWSVLG